MRLTSLSLENYGNFEARQLSLDPSPGHINLIVAPNEGGKTVLRRAFRDLLFGIPSRSPMAFRFGYTGMRLIATGVDDTGARFVYGRRRGIANTLIDGDGNSLSPATLRGLIGEVDAGLFERLFALDSQLLRSGAEAMLASGGDLGEALFAAGSGIAGLRRMREDFDTLRTELAPERRTRSRPFYSALEQFGEAVSDLRAANIRPRDWEEMSAKLVFIKERKASLIERQGEIRAEIQLLERIKRVRPWLDGLGRARQEIAGSATAPRLPADTEKRWRDAREGIALAEQTKNTANDQLQRIISALAASQPDAVLLDNSERIDALQRARDQITADRRDLPRREAERLRTAARLNQLLSALGVQSYDEIVTILPNGPQIAAARELVTQHTLLCERLRNTGVAASRNEGDIAAAEAELAQIEELEDTDDLAVLVAEIRSYGDPTRLLADLHDRSSREEARLRAAFG